MTTCTKPECAEAQQVPVWGKWPPAGSEGSQSIQSTHEQTQPTKSLVPAWGGPRTPQVDNPATLAFAVGNPALDANGKGRAGVAILSAFTIFGVWSAINPSYFTLRSFAGRSDARKQAVEGLLIGLGVSTVASVGMYWVFKDWVPAAVSEATALILTGIGFYAVYREPSGMPAIQDQG